MMRKQEAEDQPFGVKQREIAQFSSREKRY
jgi:hypothetical protein